MTDAASIAGKRTTSGDRLPFREKFFYGFGDLASCFYWQTFMVYLAFFYTDVFGITAAAAATMLGLSRSIDAWLDPVVGIASDRVKTRWGKFRPFLLWFCVPFAVTGVLTFTTPGFAESGKIIWAWITYNLLMILYTAINIPYTALLGVISADPNERTQVSSIKFIFAYIGGATISFALLPLAKLLGGGNTARGWQLSFIVIGIVAVASFLIAFLGTKERVSPPPTQRTSILRDLRDLVGNGPWLILLASTLMLILFIAVRSSVMTHYFKYYVGTRTVALPELFGGTKEWGFEWLVSAFNTTGQIGSIAGVLLLPFFARRVGRKAAFVTLCLISVASTAAFYVVRPDQLWLIFGLNFIGTITAGPLSPLLWAMYADTADYGEWKTGRRATGLVFSASIFAQKQGWAIAAAIALGLMAHVGFHANVEQTPDTLHALLLLVSLIPAVFGLLAITVLAFYPLHEARVEQIGAELRERRA